MGDSNNLAAPVDTDRQREAPENPVQRQDLSFAGKPGDQGALSAVRNINQQETAGAQRSLPESMRGVSIAGTGGDGPGHHPLSNLRPMSMSD